MAEKVDPPGHIYDSDLVTIAVDINCDKLVQSMDPVSTAPKLVSRGLISSQQAQDVLDDRVKTRSERNLAFLNLIKSSSDPTWFSSLLEVLGENKTTERLKEVLEKCYRTVESRKCHGLSHASQIASVPERSSESSSGVTSAAKKPLLRVRHPLEVEFLRLKDTLVTFLEETKQPTVKELRKCCSYLVETDNESQPRIAQELERAESYAEILEIVFLKLCRWLHFSFLEMIADYFSLRVMHSSLEQYKRKLQPVLQLKFDHMEEALKEAKITEDIPPEGMRKIVVKYNLDAGGITLEDIASYRQFLSSILEIPHHLQVFISILYGSLVLELWIPEELTPRVVRRVEVTWRELWRRSVEGIEVGERNFDLLQFVQKINREKVSFISATLSVNAAGAAEAWKGVVSSIGRRLYEEYGRHESLQSCVRKHKEAGCPSPEDLGALEWLLLHHTPEVAEKEGRDPLAVLLTTLHLGCCDVEEFMRAVEQCLEDDPAVERRVQRAFREFELVFMEFCYVGYLSSPDTQGEVITQLPDEAVTRLYLKYRHLSSLQACVSPGVKDPQHLSPEEVGTVKWWFQDHIAELNEGRDSTFLHLTLVEAGVTDEELKSARDRTDTAMYLWRMTMDIARTRELFEMMEMTPPHSQKNVRDIQDSFRRYLAHAREAVSPDVLLQAANSQRRDIFQLFFEALEERKADLEPHKSYLRGKVPPHYQQDLEQAFALSAGAMKTSPLPKEKQASGPALASPTGSSSGDFSNSPHLQEMKRQFQLQVANMVPLFSSPPKKEALSEELARTPLFIEHDSSDVLMSTEDSSAINAQFIKLVSWYEVSFMNLVTGILMGASALEELSQFVKSRDDSLQYTSLPECFPRGPLTADQLAPPLGYTLLKLTLRSSPEDISMGHLWYLKEQLCSSLALQPYALLLKGYMEGSTHIIFYISQRVSLDEDKVAAMFEGAKRAGFYPHSITTAVGTAQQVEHHLVDLLPVIRRKVRGQMEGLPVAEREQSATDSAQQ